MTPRLLQLLQPILLGAVLSALLLPLPIALAQSNAPDILRVRQTVGAYDLEAVLSPAVPILGVSNAFLTVRNAETSAFIEGADVRVLARFAGSEEQGYAVALPIPQSPGAYAAELNFDRVGTWDLQYEVTSGLGTESVAMTVEVPAPPRNMAGLFILGLVVVVIAAIFIRIGWATRTAARRRQTDA